VNGSSVELNGILAELNAIISTLNIPVETGVFSDIPPDEYAVLTPMTDQFELFGDNLPRMVVSEVRISLFSKNNYIERKNQISKTLFSAGFTITGSQYISHEDNTGYHHYAIDAAKDYIWDIWNIVETVKPNETS